MSRHRLLAAAFVLVATAACGDACAPPTPPPPVEEAPTCDAGDDAFVREATLALLGRRPLSEAEVTVAVQAIAAVDAAEGTGAGRRAFASSLTKDPAYLARWSDHLLDALYVPRTGFQALGECYGEALVDDVDPELAAAVRDAAADDGAVVDDPFSYLDLLRSSLVLDDVSPVYRAHLFAMLTKPNPCGNVDEVEQELAFRDEIGGTFDAAYVNRDPVCLACHNSESSVTDAADAGLDRHWPVFGKLEEAVFGSSFDVDPVVSHGALRVTGFLGEGGGGGGFGLDPLQAYCASNMSIDEAACTDGALVPCDDDEFGPLCIGALDEPFCAVDEAGAEVARCTNTPVCYSPNFDEVEAAACSGGGVVCAQDGWTVLCGTGEVEAACEGDTPVCPDVSPGGPGAPDGALLPWGADAVCGVFAPAVEDDIADVDAHFASARGLRATVLDLERALRRGVDALAVRGIAIDDAGRPDGPDEAFAALVAMHVVDGGWKEVMGAPLTIATRFPRNAAQAETLATLTDGFVRSHWSLEELLVNVVTHPLFNQPAPDAGCGDAYALPAVFDPWVLAEPVAAERNNSAADGLHALSSRTLTSAAYAALGWPRPESEAFPEGGGEDGALSERQFQRGIGVFHGISEKGFRGLDFQARLTWESRFGACAPPPPPPPDDDDAIGGAAPDFIADLAARAIAADATVGDAVLALKERLVGEPQLVGDERRALTTLVGELGDTAGPDLEGKLRRVCGALLESPQFQLTGLAPLGGAPTSLSPTPRAACEALGARGLEGWTITCDDAGATLAR